MLYYVPLEYLDERYTISMDKLLRKAFEINGIDYRVIEGKNLSNKIESGAFLDFAGTNYFKSSQIQKIAQLFFEGKVKNGDIFLFSDLWFPGIDALPYMAKLGGVDIKIVGCLHAGSWTPSDFVAQSLREYCKYIERGWFEFFDQIYVGSFFHKKEIIDNLTGKDERKESIDKKIIVTRLPYDYDYVRSFHNGNEKQRKVIFPHRFHWEKGADRFLEMAICVNKKMPDIDFVITSGRSGEIPLFDRKDIEIKYFEVKKILGEKLHYKSGLKKDDYYRELNSASVLWSGAIQENFGYSVLEACTLGVCPVLPNRVVYPEIYPKEYLYDEFLQSCNMVIDFIRKPRKVKQNFIKLCNGTQNIIDQIRRII